MCGETKCVTNKPETATLRILNVSLSPKPAEVGRKRPATRLHIRCGPSGSGHVPSVTVHQNMPFERLVSDELPFDGIMDFRISSSSDSVLGRIQAYPLEIRISEGIERNSFRRPRILHSFVPGRQKTGPHRGSVRKRVSACRPTRVPARASSPVSFRLN
jgi:hypothetical protein